MRVKEFVTSDLHIGHKSILNFCPDRAGSLDEMHRKIIKRFNSVVGPDDICWFLGDIGLCSSDIMQKILSKLKCRSKILIIGNHDKGVNAMYNLGFDGVMYNATKIIAGQVVSMSHCPLLEVKREDTASMEKGNPDENWHGELREKYRKYTMRNHGQFHLHAHTHAPNGGKSKVKLGRQWDIGLDGNNMAPVSFGQIESWIVKTLRAEKLALEQGVKNW